MHSANPLPSISDKELSILIITVIVRQINACALSVTEYCRKPERWIRDWHSEEGCWSHSWPWRGEGVIFSVKMKSAGKTFGQLTEIHLHPNAAERIFDVLQRNHAYWYLTNELRALMKGSER